MNVSSSCRPGRGHWTDFAQRRANPSERGRLRLFSALIVIDASAIIAGCATANLLRYGALSDPSTAPTMAFVLLPLYLIFAASTRCYAIETLLERRISVTRALVALTCAAAAVVFLAFLLRASGDFSRLAFTYATAATALLLVAGRMLFATVSANRYGGAMLAVVVIADDAAAPPLAGVICVDAHEAGLRPDVGDPLAMDRIGRFLSGADRVIVACPRERRQAWAMTLKGTHIQGEIVDPAVSELGAIGTRSYDVTGTIIVSVGALSLRDRAVKRLLDIGLALPGIVILLPLLVLAAAAIWLEDRGPILFTQQRMGRGNRLFRIYKLRSMRTGACDATGTRSTGRNDDRVTRVGRVIRRTSIDELPQLFNVLKGEMSFVGPRPHALGSLAGDKLFWEVDPRYWHRHVSKPGLTGLAQIRGLRGATLAQSDLTRRLQADLEYMSGWTLLRDIRILLATARVVVHRNAF